MQNFFNKKITEDGFTIVELMISLGIFALMTALLLAKYGNFNQGVLLTNLAYDVALTIRNAQSYGLNVKSADRSSDRFTLETGGGVYGTYFSTQTSADKAKFIFFVDLDNDGTYDVSSSPEPTPTGGSNSETLAVTNIKRGSVVESLCVISSSNTNCDVKNNLSIIFKRPEPDAIIRTTGDATLYKYAKITLKATDGTTKDVEVRSTGQISVKSN